MEKGYTNNPNGRPAGTPNRITADLREFLKQLLTDNLEQFKTDFEQLEPKDRLIMMERFLSYILPKLSGITIKEEIIDDKKLKSKEHFMALIEMSRGEKGKEMDRLVDLEIEKRHRLEI